ncbi:hypothetical protein GCM10010168_21760 [Actinoplanes ianthinogenes]|nr:hypothetical protein [Actinoplanes ianthinogenes]GGR04367.1 hypothetical protein GCM10010168_21760 [Actinoplanes ianthinogenes]
MLSEPADTPWAEPAGRRLAEGNGVRAVFLSLLRDGAEPDAAAIAVCVAAGSGRKEAVDRLGQFSGLWEALQPGEEADGVDLLIAHGYFEPDVALDDRQQAALAHLHAALQAVPGVPSGAAASLSTQLRTGRLVEARQQLERLGGQRWSDNTRFWTAMRQADEILGSLPDRTLPTE